MQGNEYVVTYFETRPSNEPGAVWQRPPRRRAHQLALQSVPLQVLLPADITAVAHQLTLAAELDAAPTVRAVNRDRYIY